MRRRTPRSTSTDTRFPYTTRFRSIGRRALGAQRRQHDVENVLIVPQHGLQRVVESARLVAFGRADEFIFEAEAVEKFAQHRIIVMRETFELAERIGNSGERLAQIDRKSTRLNSSH